MSDVGLDNLDEVNDYSNNYDVADAGDLAAEARAATYDRTMLDLANTSTEEIIQQKLCKYVRELNTFFRDGRFAVEKGDLNTNIINVLERRCYVIPPESLGTFFDKLEKCRRANRSLHYNERQYSPQCTHSGLMIDFDRYQSVETPMLQEHHFTALSQLVVDLLNSYIGFKDATIHVFITRKPAIMPAPTKTGQMLYKDGFHMVLPEVMISKGLKKYLIDDIVNKKILSKIFGDIENIEPAEKMLDAASASNPMHFFGNSKVSRPPYRLQHVYNYRYYYEGMAPCQQSVALDSIQDHNLTYELSLCTQLNTICGRPTWLKKMRFDYKPELETRIQVLLEKTQYGLIPDAEIDANDTSVDLLCLSDPEARYIRQLLDIIDISYASSYEKWFMVVCAICNTSTRYKDLAVHFSHRKPDAWSETEIDRIWEEALRKKHPRPVTKRSIIHWAKTSSPVRFREIQNETYTKLLRNYVFENEGRVEHAMVASLLKNMIGDKFMVDVEMADDNGRKIYRWYEFVQDGQSARKGEIYKWRREADPDNIHLYISDIVTKTYNEILQEIKQQKDDADSAPLMKYWHNVEKTFKSYKSKLSDNTFQVNVIRQAQYRFRVRGFLDELDKYEEILGVGNGVLVLGQQAQLIRGFHEYRVSKYTETDYVPYNPNCPYVIELLRVIHEIFPEDDVFNFMLLHGSTWLDACDPACLILLLVGGGQNGKSFWLRMLHNTLGNMYVSSGKIALLSSPNERAESANSAQMQIKDKRGFYFEEANKSEVLNSSRVKLITSPGVQSGRDLHKCQENFRNTCNVVCASNYDYIIDCTDHGTWRRVAYYKNKVKFCANPDPRNPYERKENPNIMRVYPNDARYKQAMLSILVHYSEILRTKYNGDLKQIPVPTIEAETYQFRRRQDTLHRFIMEMIVYSPETEAVPLYTVASRYQEWYAKTVRSVCPDTAEITSQLENSCLAQSFEHRGNGILFMTKHRVKLTCEDPTMPGERDLVPESVQSARPVTIDNTTPVPERPVVHDDIQFNEATTYMQTRECEKKEIDLNAVCEMLGHHNDEVIG